MAAVIICSDFGAQKKKTKSLTISTVSPSICHEVLGPDAMIFVFWMLSFKPTFSLSTFTFIKRLFSSSSLSAIRCVICISEVIGISPSNLDSSLCFISPAFLMMYSTYKLNKHSDNIHTPFPIRSQSVPCPVLTVVSWPAYRFLKRQVRCSGWSQSYKIVEQKPHYNLRGKVSTLRYKAEVMMTVRVRSWKLYHCCSLIFLLISFICPMYLSTSSPTLLWSLCLLDMACQNQGQVT